MPVTGDTNDQNTGNDDPAENLKRIDQLESKLNTVENTSAVSIVFLMKSTGLAQQYRVRKFMNLSMQHRSCPTI